MEGYAYSDYRSLDGPVSTAGGFLNTTNTNQDIICVNVVGEGYRLQERIGESIRLQSLDILSPCGLSWASPGASMCVRMFVVYDRFPVVDATGLNIIPNYEDIFKNAYATGFISTTCAFLNAVYADRFEILLDEQVQLEPGGVAAAGNYTHRILRKKVDLAGRPTYFAKSTLGLVSVVQGALYVGWRQTAVLGTPTGSGNPNSFCRLYFWDK